MSPVGSEEQEHERERDGSERFWTFVESLDWLCNGTAHDEWLAPARKRFRGLSCAERRDHKARYDDCIRALDASMGRPRSHHDTDMRAGLVGSGRKAYESGLAAGKDEDLLIALFDDYNLGEGFSYVWEGEESVGDGAEATDPPSVTFLVHPVVGGGWKGSALYRGATMEISGEDRNALRYDALERVAETCCDMDPRRVRLYFLQEVVRLGGWGEQSDELVALDSSRVIEYDEEDSVTPLSS